ICAEFGQVLGPHISYDIGLAVARMDEFVTRCKAALAASFALATRSFGSFGSGLAEVFPGSGLSWPGSGSGLGSSTTWIGFGASADRTAGSRSS
ncbi:MAG: hypothetical protein JSV48_22545, partial [Bradyrhizobium sp.]